MSIHELRLLSGGIIAVSIDEYGITLACGSNDGMSLYSTLSPGEARDIATALVRAADNQDATAPPATYRVATPSRRLDVSLVLPQLSATMGSSLLEECERTQPLGSGQPPDDNPGAAAFSDTDAIGRQCVRCDRDLYRQKSNAPRISWHNGRGLCGRCYSSLRRSGELSDYPMVSWREAPREKLSGYQRRKARVARGLPARYPSEEVAHKVRERVRKNRKSAEKTRSNFIFVARLKVERGCSDCGYNKHPDALDFDHLPGTEKRCGVAYMMRWSRKLILEEIAKCEVVCANCHRIRTWQRKVDAGIVNAIARWPQ